jgi:PTS system nitrogen regulatory IIA component
LYDLNQREVFSALAERESLGPTGMGDGIAIPHARVSKVDSVKGIFVRLEKPISFDSVDGIPVDLVFALFAPLGTNGDHLKALARVSRLLRSKNTRHKLRSNQDSSVIYSILTEENEEKAA